MQKDLCTTEVYKVYFLYRLSRPLETGNVLYFHLHKNLGQNLII